MNLATAPSYVRFRAWVAARGEELSSWRFIRYRSSLLGYRDVTLTVIGTFPDGFSGGDFVPVTTFLAERNITVDYIPKEDA